MNNMQADLTERLRAGGELDGLDEHFIRLLLRLNGDASPDQRHVLEFSACLLSSLHKQGHVCLDLGACAGQQWYQGIAGDSIQAPAREPWLEQLRACRVVAEEGAFCPLVLSAQGRLYLYRHWKQECRVAQHLRRLAGAAPVPTEDTPLQQALQQLFPLSADAGAQDLRLAAAIALSYRLCVISGGPGTGKTTSIISILALLLKLGAVAPGRIALVAPTGRAAARMQRAIAGARQGLQGRGIPCEAIPAQAQTLHRLLGVRPFRSSSLYHRDHRLPLDVLVVDEASMIDLSLMAKLLDALPEDARLFLLGDPDQLAPVELGAGFGELCRTRFSYSRALRARAQAMGGALPSARAAQGGGVALDDTVICLRHNYRFSADSGIARLAQAVRAGDSRSAVSLMEDPAVPELQFLSRAEQWEERIREVVVEGFRSYLDAIRAGQDAQSILRHFQRFRVLSVLRRGPWGVEGLNRRVRALLHQHRLLPENQTWYTGRPVMILQNHYDLDLYNGDVGIVLPASSEEPSRLQVVFESVGSDLRRIETSRLPGHEDAFALTVHKSQGSEFDRVLLALPPADHALLSRELIYTGITRARRRLTVWGTAQVWGQALLRRTQHFSGFAERLRPALESGSDHSGPGA